MKAKRVLGGILACALVAWNSMPSVQSLRNIPDLIHLTPGEEKSYSFFLPITVEVEEDSTCVLSSTDETLGSRKTTLTTEEPGSAQVEFSLLGWIPLKTVEVRVEDTRILIPGGQSIGLTLFTDGVFIVDSAEVYLPDGTTVNPARDAGLNSGDLIKRVNGESIDSMQDLTDVVRSSNGGALSIEYVRDGDTRTTTVEPATDETGQRRLGIWVRDSTAGIGTLTYIDPQENAFGALGHAVTDLDTGSILPIDHGQVYLSEIVDVQKGTRGQAGELHGVFTGNFDALETLSKNTEFGVYGTAGDADPNPLYPEGLPAAAQSEVELGPATILTTIDDRGVQEFDCEIIRLTPQASKASRSMVVEITDPDLLSVTGGIVQGMSGSPILQNGKIVGAVTHVYVNDPTKGYGLYIDWMLDTQ
ncbi:MAG: SpoIVB peptidase [Candidatus Spyradocola sp.]|jgi:stage IV sporulation protein B